MAEQYIVYTVLVIVLGLFIWGKWRYDLVSILALLTLVFMGIVPADDAFTGFGHPAVITVAAVLILSRALMNSGIVDLLSRVMLKQNNSLNRQLAILVAAVTICSAFMNNIGALALFMPVAIQIARKSKRSPSIYLMPLAFGSLLGGLMTQIGTPPNIVISLFRAETAAAAPFQMFDFFSVGFVVALAGFVFISVK